MASPPAVREMIMWMGETASSTPAVSQTAGRKRPRHSQGSSTVSSPNSAGTSRATASPSPPRLISRLVKLK